MGFGQVDSRGFTDLMLAVEQSDAHAVRCCLERSDSLDARNQAGDTALAIAVRSGYEAIAIDLIEAGAAVNLANFDCNTPLILACTGEGSALIVRKLVEMGARVQTRNALGETALHLAAYYGHLESARLLIAAGADVNAPDVRGNRPLHQTRCYAWTAIAELLIAAGADTAAVNHLGEHPFAVAPSFKAHAFVSKSSENIKEEAKHYAAFASNLTKTRQQRQD